MPFDGRSCPNTAIVEAMERMLDKPGKWSRHWGDSGKRCVYHALADATKNFFVDVYGKHPVSIAMEDVAAKFYGEKSWCPGETGSFAVAYNDDREITHADILNFLRLVKERVAADEV